METQLKVTFILNQITIQLNYKLKNGTWLDAFDGA